MVSLHSTETLQFAECIPHQYCTVSAISTSTKLNILHITDGIMDDISYCTEWYPLTVLIVSLNITEHPPNYGMVSFYSTDGLMFPISSPPSSSVLIQDRCSLNTKTLAFFIGDEWSFHYPVL